MESKGKMPKNSRGKNTTGKGITVRKPILNKGGGRHYHLMKPKGKVPKTTWGKSTIGRESPKLQVSKILITNIVPF